MLLCTLLLALQPVDAQQKSRKVRQLETKRKTLLKEIDKTNQLLKQTDSSRKLSLRKLNLLTQQVKARRELIAALNSDITATQQEITSLQTALDSLQVEFGSRQAQYVKSLRALQYRRHGDEQLLFILSASDFQQGIRRARYLSEYAAWQRQEGERLRGISDEVKLKKAEMQEQYAVKQRLLTEREAEQVKLQQSEAQSREEVAKLQQQKKTLQQQLSKKQQQAQALNREIEQQIAREVEAAAKRAREAEAAAARKREQSKSSNKSGRTKSNKSRVAESTTPKGTAPKTAKGNYEMNAEETKLSGSFSSNQGKLPAPITGGYRVVSNYGTHSYEHLSQVKVNSNGIDLQGQQGADARAVFDGVVTRIFVVDGFNTSIIVRHGNYLTVYSNLSSVYVKSGEKVKGGQLLGKVFSDPEVEGASILHFQVWKERKSLNPRSWLRR